MGRWHTVPWWKRLLLALASGFLAILVNLSLVVLRDITLGGLTGPEPLSDEGPVVLYGFLVMGGVALSLFPIIAAPLVLLWPVQSQIRHWYAFTAASFLLFAIGKAVTFRGGPGLLGLLPVDWTGLLGGAMTVLATSLYLIMLHRSAYKM